MAEIGVTSDSKLLFGIGQGYRLMQAMNTVERKLIDRTFRHGGAGLMNWAVGNCRVEAMATAKRITKANAGDAKIDPVMAMFDAVELMKLHPTPTKKPQYQMFFVG
jgi:phage terminase large subunit-like protein